MEVPPLLIEAFSNLPVVVFALFIYYKESKRVDEKDKELSSLIEKVTANQAKTSEHLDRLSQSIDRLDGSIDDLLIRVIEKK